MVSTVCCLSHLQFWQNSCRGHHIHSLRTVSIILCVLFFFLCFLILCVCVCVCVCVWCVCVWVCFFLSVCFFVCLRSVLEPQCIWSSPPPMHYSFYGALVLVIGINPFTAMLAMSLWKRPIKVPNLKLLRPSPLHMSMWKDYQIAQYWKQSCDRTIKYTVCRHVLVHFLTRKFYRLGQWRG